MAAGGLPLGLLPEAGLATSVLWLAPGEALLLYTDGVTEARRGREELGGDRLVGIVTATAGMSADTAAGYIQDQVLAWQDGAPRDDTALLVFGIPGV